MAERDLAAARAMIAELEGNLKAAEELAGTLEAAQKAAVASALS